MTKKDIVRSIADKMGLTQLQTKDIVQKTLNAIVETLVEEKRIELRNFGVFEVKKRAARKARNPRTSESVFVPAKYVVTFKPGKRMEQMVRALEDLDAAEQAARDSAGDESPVGDPPSPPVERATREPRLYAPSVEADPEGDNLADDRLAADGLADDSLGDGEGVVGNTPQTDNLGESIDWDDDEAFHARWHDEDP